MPQNPFKLVEEYSGIGDLVREEEVVGRVRYRIDRYQGMLPGSGMPIPGLHRLEGKVDVSGSALPTEYVGDTFTLRLEDGRSLRITLTTTDGCVLAEGHGPGRGCSCC